MIIDAYTHIFPQTLFDAFQKRSIGLSELDSRLRGIKPLYDLDARFAEMDHHGDYRQIVTLAHPPLEEVASAAVGAELARIANDAMADICRRHRDRFPAFVASVSLLDPDGAVLEIERAITTLGARGVQIYTNVAGRPLDHPDYEPIFALMARHGLPIWLHPARTAAHSDYAVESKSRFELWWCFGWPYETSIAVARLIFWGLLDRYPKLKIVTHHLGGMIAYFDGRIGSGMQVLGSRTPDEDYSKTLSSLKRPHLDYFRDIYADTALFGGSTGLLSGFRFYGADQIVFATDSPLGPIAPTLASLDVLELSAEDYAKITRHNAERLIGMNVGG